MATGNSKGKSVQKKKNATSESEEEYTLPKKMIIKKPGTVNTELMTVIAISLSISAVGFIYWILQCINTGKGSFDYAHTPYHFFAIGFVGIFGPTSFYFEKKRKALEALEDKFPDFLKDLAEYWKGGISMNVAIETLARGEYGGLTDEIKKMAIDISWGISFGEVLEMFAERVPTPLIVRSVALVKEANLAGGQISEILLTAADDAREIRYLKEDKVSQLSAYSMVGYISFAVYLAVVALLITTFLPSIAETTAGLGGSSGGIGGITIHPIDVDELSFIFFGSSLVQAIGIGLMSGAMTYGNVQSGLVHCFRLIVLTWLIFGFML